MQLSVEVAAAIAAGIAVLLLAVWWRIKSRASRVANRPVARGPNNMRFICAGCSGEFTHTKRTVAAWEKGSRRVFCDACHKKWRNAQPTQSPGTTVPREHTRQRDSTSPPVPRFNVRSQSRSGCLGIAVFMVVIPVILFALATHA